MRSPWLVTIPLCLLLLIGGIFLPATEAGAQAADTAGVVEEVVEEEEVYNPGGASVTATVPETPFNTRNSFLAKLSHPMPPPLNPEQQATAIAAMGALSITLFACYVFNLGAHT